MPELRKQLNVDYLKQEKGSPRGKGFLNEAIVAYSGRVLETLKKANRTSTVYDLIDTLNLPIDVVLAVTDYLDSAGFLRVVKRDLKGNHELELTPKGRRFS